MDAKVLYKLEKILTLEGDDAATDGERAAARRMLQRILDKHGLTMSDALFRIEGSKIDRYPFTAVTNGEKTMLYQLIMRVKNEQGATGWSTKRGKTYDFDLTEAQADQVTLEYKLYRVALKTEVETKIKSFILRWLGSDKEYKGGDIGEYWFNVQNKWERYFLFKACHHYSLGFTGKYWQYTKKDRKSGKRKKDYSKYGVDIHGVAAGYVENELRNIRPELKRLIKELPTAFIIANEIRPESTGGGTELPLTKEELERARRLSRMINGMGTVSMPVPKSHRIGA